MIVTNPFPSLEYVKSRLIYDPETGEFTWKLKRGFDWRTRAWNTKHAGKRAGSYTTKGVVHLRFTDSDGELGCWSGHRLAFLIMTGREPAAEIDHIDRNPRNNAWSNLREATRSENNCNRSRPSHSTTGIKGASRQANGSFKAHVRHQGRRVHLGFWKTAEDAGKVARLVRKFLHGEFAHHH